MIDENEIIINVNSLRLILFYDSFFLLRFIEIFRLIVKL